MSVAERVPRPDWIPQSFRTWDVTYEFLIESRGIEIIKEAETGDYQGDLFFLLRDSEDWGFLVVAYGSCSQCDALQDALAGTKDWDEEGNPLDGDWVNVVALRDQILGNIRWRSTPAELAETLRRDLNEGEADPNRWWMWGDVNRSILEDFAVRLKEYDGG